MVLRTLLVHRKFVDDCPYAKPKFDSRQPGHMHKKVQPRPSCQHRCHSLPQYGNRIRHCVADPRRLNRPILLRISKLGELGGSELMNT